MRRRATASWAAPLAAMALVTAGCTSTPVAGSEAELVWAAGPSSEMSVAPAEAIADRWNKLHPDGPRVRVRALPESADDQHQQLKLELNAGLDEFDILELDLIWTAEFAQNGWLVDLEELRPDLERVSLPVAVQSAVWDGRLWAAPYTTDAGILYYRSDLVEEPPTTWEELRDVGLRVGAKQGIAPLAADGEQYEGMVVQYLEYFWGAGGDFDRFTARDPVQRDNALKAANFMRKAFFEGVFAPGYDGMKHNEARDTFQSGQAVFMRSWPYVYREMNRQDPDSDSQVIGKVGIAPLPTFAGSGASSGAALGGHNLAVSRFSDNVPAATEFVRFVSTSREVQRELVEQYSLAPTLRASYEDPSGDPLVDLLAAVLPTAKARPAVPEWTTISEEMQQQIFAAYTGDNELAPEIDALRNFIDATTGDR